MLLTYHIRKHFAVKAYNASKNYYKILNISQTANEKDIKKAFRQLAKKYHPDSNKGKQQQFKQVNQAYQVLSDQNIKKQYDQVRKSNTQFQYQHRTSSGNNNSYYQNQSYNQNYKNVYNNNYRGYQREEGWRNPGFKEQFMYDFFKQQQQFNQNQQQYNQYISKRNQYNRNMGNAYEQYDKFVKQALRQKKGYQDNIRKYNEQSLKKQEQIRKKYEQQQKLARQRQYEQYRKYQDQSINDMKDKLKSNLHKVTQGIAYNMKDFLKIGEDLKDLWKKLKDNHKK